MSCGDEIIFIRAGATWKDPILEYRDDDDVLIPLTGLNVRGVLRDSAGNVVMTLDSAGGSPKLLINATGFVTPNVASSATGALIENAARTELKLYLEFYDGGSPVEITPFVPDVGYYSVVVTPDQIP